jgi:hypothetical protein
VLILTPCTRRSVGAPKGGFNAIAPNSVGDLWGWTTDVFARIADVSVYWLVLALALKTGESGLIGLVWRNILRATHPKSGLHTDEGDAVEEPVRTRRGGALELELDRCD